jgi:hypothetical protein
VTLVAALQVALLAGCGGGSSPSADSVLRATFSSHRPVASGRVHLSLTLGSRPSDGALLAPGLISLHLTGAFQGVGRGRLPRLSLALRCTAGAQTRAAGVVSTGGRLYLTLGGATFLAPTAAMASLEQGYAQVRGGSVTGGGLPTFATLGIEPAAWLTHPSLAGRATVGGADTIHVVAALDVTRFLADATRLWSAGEALTGRQGGALEPVQTRALASSVRSARVDVYTGARDHLLRRLSLTAVLSGGPGVRTAAGTFPRGRAAFELRFEQLNVPQTIAVPSRALPPSALGAALERLSAGRGPVPR